MVEISLAWSSLRAKLSQKLRKEFCIRKTIRPWDVTLMLSSGWEKVQNLSKRFLLKWVIYYIVLPLLLSNKVEISLSWVKLHGWLAPLPVSFPLVYNGPIIRRCAIQWDKLYMAGLNSIHFCYSCWNQVWWNWISHMWFLRTYWVTYNFLWFYGTWIWVVSVISKDLSSAHTP